MNTKFTHWISARKHGLELGLFVAIALVLVNTVWLFTKDKIQFQIQHNQEKVLQEILPKAYFDNHLLEDVVTLPNPELLHLDANLSQVAYVAKLDGKPSAILLPVVAPDGYSGKIHLMVGILSDGTIAGVRAVAHRETPGLGDAIDTNISDWIYQFNGRHFDSKREASWHVKKDHGQFDQITGATITSRAVVRSLKKTLFYFKKHKTELFTLNHSTVQKE